MRFTIILSLLFFIPFFVGCKQDNPFGVVYVEGIVTLDGVPIEGVNVTFSPREAGADLAAGGVTDASGKFTLTAGGSPVGSGARPGTYDVTFTKVTLSVPPPLSTPVAGERPAPQPQFQQQIQSLIPQRYESARTSGIDPITVSDKKGDNKFKFELTK
jgi:hypothetical protein